MSFYNMLFGKNSNSAVILALLEFKEPDIERFRDCHIQQDGITIYTRTGGNNRENYPNEKLTSSPYYLRDEDEDDDNTYATFYFKFPDELKEDIVKFLDVKANGVPASIVNKCLEVWNRPETDEDKYQRILTEQTAVYKELRMYYKLFESNGHTIVPLCDSGMERLLMVAEKNDYPELEGEFFPYAIRPYKLKIETDVPEWSHKKDQMARLKISIADPWTIDDSLWEDYKSKFSAKYPKAIAAINKYIERSRNLKNTP
jgi:hypothetical protein